MELERALSFSGRGEGWWFRLAFEGEPVLDAQRGKVSELGQAWVRFWALNDTPLAAVDFYPCSASVLFDLDGELPRPESLLVWARSSGLLDSIRLGEATVSGSRPVPYSSLPEPGEEARLRCFGEGQIFWFKTWDLKGREEEGVFSGDTLVQLGDFLAVLGLDTLTAQGLDFKLDFVSLSLRRPP